MGYQIFFVALFLVSGIFGSLPAVAVKNTSPIAIALFPPLQFPSSDFEVTGLRLSIVGKNRAVSGLDIGLLGNMTDQSFSGIAIAGLFNYNKTAADIIGLQVAGIANVNGIASSLYGIQIGLYNKVNKVYGFQLGLINVAKELHGIQIGLINFNEAGPFKASPIINASF